MRSAFLLLLCLVASAVQAQDVSLVEQYRKALFTAQAQRILAEQGLRAPYRPVDHVPSDADTVWVWLGGAARGVQAGPPPPPPLEIASYRLLRKLERPWFEKEFGRVAWAYIGANRITPLDTMFTTQLRARLQGVFGDPTRTLAEESLEERKQRDEFIQFEYWFVLNDSIPLKVMDVNGPLERGLVVVTDSRHRELLPELKRVFLEAELLNARPVAYVDYYYVKEYDAWFRTGYRNGRFFTDRISKPDLRLGRPIMAGKGE